MERREARELGDAEVEDLDRVGHGGVREKEDVVRFDIAMNDARAVRRRQRGEHLRRDERDTLRGEHALAIDALTERLAAEHLHHEVRLLSELLGILKIRHLYDIGVAEGGDHLGLTLEPFELLAIVREPLVEQLYGDTSAQTLLDGLVHCAHSTASERLSKAIASTE